MAESSAGTAAFLSGEEIVNDGRTMAYLAAGYGPTGLQISGGCACPRIRELIGCDNSPYSSPLSDPAPWYDAAVPESADFAGFLTTEFKGLGSVYTRENVDKLTGGAVLGRLRPKSRTLIWTGYLFGRSECAVQYGLRWLTANIKGTDCSCGGEELDVMICCPDLTEDPPISTCVSLPSIAQPTACSPFTEPNAFRTLKKVGLIDGPNIQSQRRIGCGSNCGNSSCKQDDSIILGVEFTLVAGNPYLYGCPVTVMSKQRFPDTIPCSWVKVLDGGSTAACITPVCPPTVTCITTDDACQQAVLPVIPPFKDKCFCDPIVPLQLCCPVPADTFGQFFEGAPVIQIYSGAKSMRATTIRFFANPQGLDCADIASNPCLNCDELQIRYIPAGSTLTIDGTTRTITVLCPNSTESLIADNLTVTPFAWPILQCIDYCICIETEGVQVAPNATVTIAIVPREV